MRSLPLLFFLGILLSSSTAIDAQPLPWPASWTTIDQTTDAGASWIPVQDPVDGINPSSTNFITDGTASVYSQVVGTQIFFRVAVEGNPLASNGLDNYVWTARIARQVSGVWTYTAEVGVNGKPTSYNDLVYAADAAGTVVNTVYTVFTGAAHDYYGARITPFTYQGATRYYLDWQVPLSAIQAVDNAITATSPVRVFFVTASDINNDNKDHFRCLDACVMDWSNLRDYQLNNGSLPVELTSFTVRKSGEEVRLAWNTATEKNNYGFEIQRSFNGSAWRSIGFVAGAGTIQTPQWYSYRDAPGQAAQVWYRLKQIDRDGTWCYSTVSRMDLTGRYPGSEIVSVYPNPSGPEATITYSLRREERVTLRIVDEMGRQVRTLLDGDARDAGTYTLRMEAANLHPGKYFCLLGTEQGMSIKTLNIVK